MPSFFDLLFPANNAKYRVIEIVSSSQKDQSKRIVENDPIMLSSTSIVSSYPVQALQSFPTSSPLFPRRTPSPIVESAHGTEYGEPHDPLPPSQSFPNSGYDFRSQSVFRSSPANLQRDTSARTPERASRFDNLKSLSVIESEIFSSDPPLQKPHPEHIYLSSLEPEPVRQQSISLPPSSPPETAQDPLPSGSSWSFVLDSSCAEPESLRPAGSKIHNTATIATTQTTPKSTSRFEPLPSSSPIFGLSSTKRKGHSESPPLISLVESQPPPTLAAAAPRKARRTQTEKTASQFEKERQRERKEREKQSRLADRNYQKALNEANRKKTLSLEESLKELCTIVNRGFLTNSTLGKKLHESLAAGRVKIDFLPEKEAGTSECFDVNVFYLKRIVTSKYDIELDMFIPVTRHIANVPLALVVVDAVELAKTRFASKAEIVQYFHDSVQAQRPSTHTTPECRALEVICVVQGLASLLRQSFNSRNQEVADRVRELMGSSTATTRRKPNVKQDPTFDPHLLDNACTDLEFLHNWKVVHSVDPVSTADWVMSLLATHGVSWYKSKSIEGLLAGGIINGDVGYIKSGVDPRDCMEKSLQQIKYVSNKIAANITSNYDSMQKLAASSHRLDQHMSKSLAQSICVLITSENPDRII